MERIQNKIAWALVVALSLLVIAALAGVVRGGPLDPPSSPGSTQENLLFQPASCDGFPIVISSPGSYKFAQSITLPGGCSKDGIKVNVGNVTIDLQGFELVGLPFPAGTTGSAIEGTVVGGNLTVRNGTIRNWRTGAIDSSGPGLVVDHIQAIGGDSGIDGGHQATIMNCRVADMPDATHGIRVLERSSISNCRVVNIVGTAITAGADTTITDTVAANNGGVGIQAGDRTVLENCIASDNGGLQIAGIVVGTGSVIRGCTASNNGGVEIGAGAGSTVENCVANGAGSYGDGIVVGPDSVVRGCTATANGTLIVGDAEIRAGDGSLVEDCVVDGFSGTGAGPGDGIVVGNSAIVRGCNSRYNQGDGIHAIGQLNRIEGNRSYNNGDNGIEVAGGVNQCIQNTAGFNSAGNYAIPANNYCVFSSGTAGQTNPFMNIE